MDGLIEIREAYGNALRDLGAVNKRVITLEADVGSSSKSIIFGKAFPERYYNVGIAEINMVSMAAGFAASGLIPFVNTFCTFMTARAADPISGYIAYDRLNVKLAGAYSGLSDSYDGASHHSINDLAFMCSLPNMTVISVCDPIETKKAVFEAARIDGPVYLRLSRAATPSIFDESYNFKAGKGVLLRPGSDVTIIATGYMVHTALEAARILSEEGISAAVVDMHTIKPIDRDMILDCAAKTGAIVTAEEHVASGGLSGAVAQVLVSARPVPVEVVAIPDFAESGSYFGLLKKYGLDSSAVAQKAKSAIKRKGC